jgi:Matrixin
MRLPSVLTATFFSAAIVGSVISAPGTASAANRATPAFCTGKGPIPSAVISSPVNLSACPIQGRLLVHRLSNGRIVGGLHVPRPGLGIVNSVLTNTGEYTLRAVNAHGRLTVTGSEITPRAAGRGTPLTSSRDPACSETAVNYLGPSWYGRTYYWFLNEDTVADRTNLNVSKTISNLRQGITNMTQGINNCGYSGTIAAYSQFQGNSSLYANINSSAQCSVNFPDGAQTDSFGPMNSSVYNQSTHMGTLASTCYAWDPKNPGNMVEDDTYFGSNVHLANSLPSKCTHAEDLQTAATHEYGHVFGLDHETSGPDEVMYPKRPWCTPRRHLGNGDWHGMKNLYGFR